MEFLWTPDVCSTVRRERMVQIMFQRYGFAGVQVQIQAVLTLYSQGRLSSRHIPTHMHHMA